MWREQEREADTARGVQTSLALAMLLAGLLSSLLFLPSILLAGRIALRPSIHNVFNITLAVYFAFLGVCGPFVATYYARTVDNFVRSEGEEEVRRSDCSLLLESRHMVGEAFKILTSNIMFRYFYIVYADRGFVLPGGRINNRLFKIIFLIITVALNLSSFLSFRLAAAFQSEEYPANTVLGRFGYLHYLVHRPNCPSNVVKLKQTKFFFVLCTLCNIKLFYKLNFMQPIYCL